MPTPNVSVVMIAYNASAFISEAIESVLAQSYPDFEFIIVDDGSTDSTVQHIESLSDKRIRLIKSTHSYIASLNKGMTLASGKYIARMDADDIMHPDRLKVQSLLMERNPTIDVCASTTVLFKTDISSGQTVSAPPPEVLKHPILSLLRGNYIFHPSCMIRRSFWMEKKLRYRDYPFAEDYRLWFEVLTLNGVIYIYPQPLLYYRLPQKNDPTRTERRLRQIQTSTKIQEEIIEYYLARLNDGRIQTYYNQLKSLLRENIISAPFVCRAMASIFNELPQKM